MLVGIGLELKSMSCLFRLCVFNKLSPYTQK